MKEAQASLPILCEYRQNLKEQLDLAKQQQPDSPIIQQLEEEIELRSLQIANTNQIIFDSDEGLYFRFHFFMMITYFSYTESKGKVRWERIQSIAEAKTALKLMMEVIGETAKEKSIAKSQISALQSRVAELEVLSSENELLVCSFFDLKNICYKCFFAEK